ncbi:hypothetical protein KP77_10850 [Jeotgalibacillus alimentarius]|uniref:Putative zinc-finger domain-containing protein n=1 Tax=Jeotgalibacillus alimentarius TaxID=135826 RepID=A0A0C2W6C7_9BACL|nr:zf-HC2 domain-containing protein [Jeotgalibacillus alimentarius]KIL51573.1 hypothetical protein KP77_10850 [Jeotgalibacillus alimentarius]
MKKECNVIQDLLPLYAENLTSVETNQYIEAHMAHCPECEKLLGDLKKELPGYDPEPAGREDDTLLMRKVKSRRVKVLTVVMLIGIFIGSMALFSADFTFVIAFILLLVYLMASDKSASINAKAYGIPTFILSLSSLMIALRLFWNVAIYVDETGSGPAEVYGGNIWLGMAWLQLLLLFVLTIMIVLTTLRRKA